MEVELSSGDLEAVFVPDVGMVGRSLRHRGQELLGQRGGLEAYADRGSSFGIPLLHPWANRLDGLRYGEVEIDPARSPVRLDGNGLPIHGLLTAASGWEVAERGREHLSARFDFADERLLAAFPFPHELTVAVELGGGSLEVVTSLRATGQRPVPVAFGWHPYLTLPGVPREDWHVEMPVMRRAELDGRGIPAGPVEPFAFEPGPLGARVFDDLFVDVPERRAFAVEGGGRRIEVVFEEGYPVGQVYAPEGQDFICFEPMTAPTNALVTGVARHVEPGESFSARFRIAVV